MVLTKRSMITREVLERIEQQNLVLFTPAIFARFFGITPSKAAVYLSRNTKKGIFIRPKRGIYFSKRLPPSPLEIANVVYKPSYISLDMALSYHHLIPETVYAITSITTKHSKDFKVLNQVYSYHKLNRNLFFGYRVIKIGGRSIIMAGKEKALLDYFYFVARGQKKYNERLNLKDTDRKKIQNYSSIFFKNIHNKYIRKRFGLLLNQIKSQ